MGKTVLGVAMSLDGYIARADGGIDFLLPPKGYSMGAMFEGVGAVAFGRKTFDDAVRRGGGKYQPPLRMPTYVFSRTLPAGERDGVIFTPQTPKAFVEAMRAKSEGDLFLMGGGELARAFLDDDVVDEVRIGVYPVMLGAGIRLFPDGGIRGGDRVFALVDSKSYQPEGLVELL